MASIFSGSTIHTREQKVETTQQQTEEGQLEVAESKEEEEF